MSDSEDRASMIKKRIECFRILIIGRANAGKTTILQRVCRSTENPEIYDHNGNKIDDSDAIIEGTTEHGLHDIENEMIFKSNPGFVFHDSRGFEAGGSDELGRIKKFIAARADKPYLKDHLHAIWYSSLVALYRRCSELQAGYFPGTVFPWTNTTELLLRLKQVSSHLTLAVLSYCSPKWMHFILKHFKSSEKGGCQLTRPISRSLSTPRRYSKICLI
ncbi:hypothetical protein HYDPIDRAFT_115415 [Hydnomerulius pinastri MD-312]|uniref:G domain-containing protein n=1 Tax=Hydnomerulius pinastri MD-312 TaxID=994086 RepID=A0A0C9V8A0_9AGAM|nr:hypothetical protein HYDPIDRAFT_115415 [Hydnomerulius pinastri MD-312]